jgi:phosphoglycolate phosphatase-like HAD superfamily hydrolase
MQTVVFLLDVDNTLLDNDAVKKDWNEQLLRDVGPALTTKFWDLYEQVRQEQGMVDIPLALSRFRQQTSQTELNETAYQGVRALFEDYPFSQRLYPHAIETLEHLRTMGLTVIVSDGDPVFQARKINQNHLADVVEKRVLIFPHKQDHLDEIRQTYPADHYVMIDDSPRILSASSQLIGDRLITVFVQQGHYAAAGLPAGFTPDLIVSHIGDLRHYQREQLLAP